MGCVKRTLQDEFRNEAIREDAEVENMMKGRINEKRRHVGNMFLKWRSSDCLAIYLNGAQ
jgi:hypothetical protein